MTATDRPSPAPPSVFRAQPLLLVALACCAGVATDYYLRLGEKLNAPGWWTLAVFSAGSGMTLVNLRCLRSSVVALVATFFCLAAAWQDYCWNYVLEDDVSRFATADAQPVCLKATTLSPPRWTPAERANPLRAIPAEPQTELDLQVDAIRDRDVMRSASGVVRLRINGTHRAVQVGDQLLIFAQLARPRDPLNPGQYDYAAAERSSGRHAVFYTRSPFCLKVVNQGSRFSPRSLLARASQACHRQLARYVGFASSEIAQAMFLGDRTQLSDETLDSFMETGTIHLLVVSGLHVGLVAGAVWLLSGWWGWNQRSRLATTWLLVVFYGFVVGGRPPVVRAAVLVSFTLLALETLRSIPKVNLLALALLVVLALGPAEVFRSGTQLSFLGVSAILGILSWPATGRHVDPLDRMFAHYWTWWQQLCHRSWRSFVGLVGASAAVWLFVAPLVLFHFHIMTPCGLLISPLVWPLVSLALVSGLAICTVGFLFPPLAWCLGKICGACLWLTTATVDWASRLPLGHFYSAAPPAWWLLALYTAIFVVALLPRLRVPPLSAATLLLLWVAVGLGSSLWQHRSGEQLRCSFLAVGHGTCVVLEFPTGETMLYDAGSLGSPRSIANSISGFLWQRGITRLDAVLLSHADVDHYNAVPELLERFRVEQVVVSPLMFEPWADLAQLSAPNVLRRELSEAEVPLKTVQLNDRLRLEDDRVNIEVLHPPRFGVGGQDNANSVVLLVQYAGHRILLPGDLEEAGLDAVMAEAPLDVDVLLAPHHGSSQSDPPGFAAWCQPDWVVLSGEYAPRGVGRAIESYRAAGATVLQTAERGCISFQLSASGVQEQCYRN